MSEQETIEEHEGELIENNYNTDETKDISMVPIEFDEAILNSNLKIRASREERKYASHTPRTKIEIIVNEGNEEFIDIIYLKSSIKPQTFKKFIELNERLTENIEEDEDNEEEEKIVLDDEQTFMVFNMLFDLMEPIVDPNGTNIPINKNWFDDIDWEIKSSLLDIIVRFFNRVMEENEKK